MAKRLCIQITEKDNVAIAVYDIAKGTEVMPGVVTAEDIPQAHKIALSACPKGTEIIRYGVVLGTTSTDIPKGGWINETNLVMAPAPDLDELEFAVNIRTDLPEAPVKTWEGYRNPKGGPAGTRNILAINTTVQCVAGVVNVAI